MSVRLIKPRFVERVWGTTRLSPLFPDQDRKIGEVWFDEGPAFSLLIKFLFTSEKLSIQVHPDDTYARAAENSRGKTEMWHILAAEPGSTIALGFREAVSEERLRASIADGTVENLLNLIPVKPGDTYFAAPGTVHAIGAGVTLCEIQQNSDVTYRLFDYGRGRELHLEKGLAVSKMGPYEGRRDLPVRCDYFTTELLELAEPVDCAADGEGVLIAFEGSGTFEGIPVRAGQVCLISSGQGSVRIEPEGKLKILHAKCGTAI